MRKFFFFYHRLKLWALQPPRLPSTTIPSLPPSTPSIFYWPDFATLRVCSQSSDDFEEPLDRRATERNFLERKRDGAYSCKLLAIVKIVSHKSPRTNDLYIKLNDYFRSCVPVYVVIVRKFAQYAARVIIGSLTPFSSTEKSISPNGAYPLERVKKSWGRPSPNCYYSKEYVGNDVIDHPLSRHFNSTAATLTDLSHVVRIDKEINRERAESRYCAERAENSAERAENQAEQLTVSKWRHKSRAERHKNISATLESLLLSDKIPIPSIPAADTESGKRSPSV